MVIPCEITHSKNVIVFILSTQSVHPKRVHNPEYQPPVTSGSRVTGCANFVNYQEISKKLRLDFELLMFYYG